MNSIEDSTHPQLIEYLDRRNIEAVGFDIDNTLLHTREYYDVAMYKIGSELALMINASRDPSEISKEIKDAVFLAYEKDGKRPRLIDERYISGLEEYLGDEVPQEMQNHVISFYKDFYHKSPVPFNCAAEVIKAFIETDRKVVLHSHAQEGWTKIKINILEKEIGYPLPYLSTSIGDMKDSKSWLKAFKIINTDAINTLVIGDNFEADIRPTMDAGSKNLVWMNRYEESLPKNLNLQDGVELIVIKEIGELIDELSTRA